MSLQSRSEARLAENLRTGLWSFEQRAMPRTLQRPSSRSKVRLSPLGDAAPPAPTQVNEEEEEFMPSPILRAPSVGHLGALWGMRHSEPSFAVTSPSPTPSSSSLRRSAPSFPSLGYQDALHGSWRKADLAGVSDSNYSCPTQLHCRRLTPSRQRDIRSRRIRRPADFGASLGSSQSRSHSCLGYNERNCEGRFSHPVDVADGATFCPSASQSSTVAMSRCSSTPPTGTVKADDAAAAKAKAAAVAALQRLFFEEMSKNGQDANGAAARALLRLSEAPSLPSVRSQCQPEDVSAKVSHESEPSKASTHGAADGDEEVPCVEEEAPARRQPAQETIREIASHVNEVAAFSPLGVPRRPLAEEGRRRRPCMHSHVKVQS